MTYFVISPKILECSMPESGLVECAVTYDMEEYGQHRPLSQCHFSIAQASDEEDVPSIRVKDPALSRPHYDAFWRGFCAYLIGTTGVDMFAERSADGLPRRYYLPDLHFDPTQKYLAPAGVRIDRH